jgi:phage gp46-like protein
MLNDPCLEQNVGNRRIFWTTRAQACGDYTTCGVVCSIPGLVYEDAADDYRSINTDDWLQGLILNILNTRARNDVRCPTPAAVFGHWSESYRDDGLYIGATLWNAAERSYIRTGDAVKAVEAAITADMNKLVALELADSVEVDAKPVNHRSVTVTITVTTTAGSSKINLSGSFVSETWVWQ